MSVYGATDRRTSSSSYVRSVISSTAVNTPTPTPLSALTRLAFYLFGVTILVPWNALILALPYLLTRLSGSHLDSNLGSWLSVSYTGSGFVALATATWLADKLKPTPCVIISTTSLVSGLLLLATLPFWSASPATILSAVIVLAVLLAISTAFFRTPIVELATSFGPDAIAAYFSGTALIAVFVSIGVFATVYISGIQGINAGRTGFVLCFVFSAVVSLLCLVAYMFLRRTDTFKRKFAPRKSGMTERDRLLELQLRMVLAQGEGVWNTMKRNLGCNVAQLWVFVVTLAVFPAITTLVHPTNHNLSPLLFNTFHILMFNLGDLAGRLLVSIPLPPILSRPTSLLSYAFLRTFFIPLFLLSNVHLPGAPSTHLIGDIGFIALLFIFALTNGHCSSLGFIAVGKGGAGKSGARVLQLWMYAGFVLGSAASFGVGRLVGSK